jgi:hypothetical protein
MQLKQNFSGITKTKLLDWLKTGKGVFFTIAGIITFTITIYNQFKSDKTTEISGYVSSTTGNVTPIDATVKIISPIQGQTETDANGRFKFKLQNLQSDTFLLLIQNKKTNMETKQNEYINAGDGRKDIFVVFNSSIKDGRVYSPLGKSTFTKKPNFTKIIEGFRFPKRR